MLTTIAVQVHHMDAMVAFYAEAFGFRFRPAATGGLASQFGRRGALTLKFVPLRDAPDFDGYPSHQLGFSVENVDAVLALAERHGGRREGEVIRSGGSVHAAVRDPDGNTLEIYADA